MGLGGGSCVLARLWAAGHTRVRRVALAQAAREAALHAIALPLASAGLGSGSGSGDAEIEHAVAETSEH